jgi:3-oxoacyl-(acyl-carrier-protein) synthase
VTSTSDKPPTGLSPWGLGNIAAELAAEFGAHGPRLTLSAACASGLHALVRAAMMIRSGEVRQALVVATEASVHPIFLGSFQRLGVLAKPGAGCRPFDRNRSGFYMSEAACAVVLEAAAAAGPSASADPAPVYLERFAIGGDATHITGGDPDGRLLRYLLHKVIGDRAVDLIHAHGTGTEANDATELSAIDASAATTADGSGCAPVVYSHKVALGHSLGASGLLSVVLNCQSHVHGIVPGNVRTTDPLPAGHVTIPRVTTPRTVRRSIAIAAGFGGPTATVCVVSP